MTYEEAIKYFKMRLAERTHPPTTAQQKAFKVAIKALEKQIPMKSGDEYYCPYCRHYFEDGEVKNYCPRCGQSMEWSIWK